jgi:hypothetical protein
VPLPDDLDHGVDWPPADHADRIARQLEHRLLWRNDPDELEAHYPTLTSSGRRGDSLVPYPSGKVIARTFASLLFGEDPTITHANPDVRTAAGAVADANGLSTLGAEAALTQAVEGEVYLRPSWATRIDPRHALIDVVPGSRAVPVFAFGRLVEVAFVTAWRLSRTDDWLRHVEYHVPGRIVHRLFRGDRRNLGVREDLGRWRQVEGIADPDELDRAGDQLALETGVDRLLPVHVPLGRDATGPHGVSAMDGLEPLILALHRLYTQEQHDAELARRRVVVTRAALGDTGQRTPLGFDRDRDLFVVDDLAGGPVGAEGAPVTPIEFRDDTAMRERITSRLGDLLVAAGISPATLLPDKTGNAPSGTSRRLAQSLTVSTVSLAARYWNRALGDVLEGTLRLEAARALAAAPSPDVLAALTAEPLTATLADGMIDDPVEVAGMVEQLARAEAASVRERVRLVHPTWTDREVDEEVDRIVADRDVPPSPSPGGLADLEDVDLDAILAETETVR